MSTLTSRPGCTWRSALFRRGTRLAARLRRSSCSKRRPTSSFDVRGAAAGPMSLTMVAALGVWAFAGCESGGSPPRNQADTRSPHLTALSVSPGGSVGDGSSDGFRLNESAVAVEAHPSSARAPLPPPGPRVSGEENDGACRKDANRALIPGDCAACPPCEPTWRQAANRATSDRVIAERKAVVCPAIACMQCAVLSSAPGETPAQRGYVGSAAVCRAGHALFVSACSVEIAQRDGASATGVGNHRRLGLQN